MLDYNIIYSLGVDILRERVFLRVCMVLGGREGIWASIGVYSISIGNRLPLDAINPAHRYILYYTPLL